MFNVEGRSTDDFDLDQFRGGRVDLLFTYAPNGYFQPIFGRNPEGIAA